MSALAYGQRFAKTIAKPLCKCNIYCKSQSTNQNRLISFPPWTVQNTLLRRPLNWNMLQMATYYAKKKEKGSHLSKTARSGLSGAAVGLIGGLIYYLGMPDPDSTENDIYSNENPMMAHLYRARDTLHDWKEFVSEPSQELLLPEPLPAPFIQPPYTLVIELNDVLIHSEYDKSAGWRYRKRPGVEQFLRALSNPLFEVVVFTSKDGNSISPVVEALNTDGAIMYKLFRDSTKYMGNTHVKDLSRLNRDLRKVIMIDCEDKACMLQPRNSFVMKKWTGDPKDIALLELIPLFQTIAMSGVDDVRMVMDFYRGEEDPVAAFRRNQDTMRQQQAELQEKQQKQKESHKSRFGLFGGNWRR